MNKNLLKNFFNQVYFQNILRNIVNLKSRKNQVTFITNKIKQKLFFHKLHLVLKQNNIYGTFRNIYNKKVLLTLNSGILSLNTTRKQLKHHVLKFIFILLKKIYPRLKRGLIIELISPKYLRFKIIKAIKRLLKKATLRIILRITPKKCFNGCRPTKNRRKKRKYNIIYKT